MIFKRIVQAAKDTASGASRLFQTLKNTRQKLAQGLGRLFGMKRDLDEAFLAELEEVLFGADLGMTGREVLSELRAEYGRRELKTTSEVFDRLRTKLRTRLGDPPARMVKAEQGPTVILIVGVNGSGKTTSCAKLASMLKRQDFKVMLAACDTYRAAATEQLSIWADRIGVPIVKQKEGVDPAAVAYDAAAAALATGVDYLVVDTAGRLHTREDLMAQLGKLKRILEKKIPGAPHESLLVLDATTGQNAIRQAEQFTRATPLQGVILAKLDGTARGGAVISIKERLGIPVRLVGTGEKPEDLEWFDPDRFLDALLQTES